MLLRVLGRYGVPWHGGCSDPTLASACRGSYPLFRFKEFSPFENRILCYLNCLPLLELCVILTIHKIINSYRNILLSNLISCHEGQIIFLSPSLGFVYFKKENPQGFGVWFCFSLKFVLFLKYSLLIRKYFFSTFALKTVCSRQCFLCL